MRLVIDSDGGIDDAAAIVWLCGRPDVELAAVTAVGGNVEVRQAARNLRVILEAAGRADVPVYVGADPADPAPRIPRPVFIHGEDGLGDVGLADPLRGADEDTPAVEVLIREMRRGASLLTLGPLTNLAAALRADAAAAASSRLTLMGGSARAQGNARPSAEANVAHDPLAAATAIGARWAAPPVMVGLDVTHTATLREAEFAALAARRTAAAAFLDGPLSFYRRNAGSLCAEGETPCHDLLAAMALVRPDILGVETLPVEVDTGGSAAWGQTVVDLRELGWRRRGEPAAAVVEPGRGPDGNEAGVGAPVAVGLTVDVDFFRAAVRELAGEPAAGPSS
ncbi:nucleoside hydrolase [Frankia sp. CNm7]|uniref:Nucleoside hydrolase n=2 Tax=Frankia nepalensis TaxID=1836974 RepID=A0A937UUR6_9ACTN|nr:nucleoside hydrolase [Frankia nepalensis]MBL7514556.1 nucleoside hydrolase [Frankia nepalensis]MBL7524403.1 nucleoside hydrolase [Frankia nepalensis]MBL7631456.1 nucleoside hydrolase [Frankia nepalensis]